MKHWIKFGAAIIASAAFTSIVATYAFAHGTAARGTTSGSKSRLGPDPGRQPGNHAVRLRRRKRGRSSATAPAHHWPPLLTKGKPHAGTGVRASLLGTTKRKDGKLEVTYNHHPLYYFVGDRKPRQTTGQGLNQFGAPWWALSPAGREIH
jgi:predicted lipoprotein with Yx(FWY)xxD motif